METDSEHQRVYYNREEDRQNKSYTPEPTVAAAYNRML